MQTNRRAFSAASPIGAFAVGGLALCIAANEAAAASAGGTVTSVSIVTTLLTLLVLKGWHSHAGISGLSALAVLAAFAIAATLFWRSAVSSGRRVFDAACPTRRSHAKGDACKPMECVDLPVGTDRRQLIKELRDQFFDLQSAWDRRSRDAMSLLTTPDMLEELWAAFAEGSESAQASEFISVHVGIIFFERTGSSDVVCVEYSGMVREAPYRAPAPFREFWMMMRSTEAPSGWRLTRHQALL